MQMAVIEYCRHVLHMKHANSAENNPDCKTPVIIYMPEISTTHMGGTLRLGSRVCKLTKGSLAYELYDNKSEIYERHRHRYEVNPEYVNDMITNGLMFTGKDEMSVRMEIVELPKNKHPYFIGTQFHPEFKSRPLNPSPPFVGLIQVIIDTHKKIFFCVFIF